MDELIVRARGTYNRLENGQLVNPGADLLASVARVLGFSEQEWAFLWQSTRKENPPYTLHSSAGTALAGMWHKVIETITDTIAYISDAEWNLVTCNEDFRLLFPRGQTPTNIMRWLLLDPEARTDVLTDWAGQWAPAMMPHLRQAVELRPDNAALVRLERDVLADPLAGPLYRDAAAVPVPFTDGSELPLRHALHGPGRLTTCLAQPILAPGARINLSIFTPNDPRHREGRRGQAADGSEGLERASH